MSAQAASFGSFDPRSLAMGGVGVTTATSRNASFFNPAALAAAQADDDFSINVVGGIRAVAPKDMLDQLSDVEDAGNAVSTALTALNQNIDAIVSAGSSATSDQVINAADSAAASQSAITSFNSALQKINSKSLEIGAAGGAIIAIPSKGLGFGFYFGGRADAGAKLNYSASDASRLTDYATNAGLLSSTLRTCDPANSDTCIPAANQLRNTITTTDGGIKDLSSTFDARGVLVSEVGLSLAHRFSSLGDLDIGITPKAVKVQTFNYSQTAQDAKIDADKGKIEQSAFTFDIGATKTYGDKYKAGIVIKNVLGKKFDFADPDTTKPVGSVLSEKYEIKPQARLGLSHHTNWTTVGLDVDLTKNEGLNGFGKSSQFVGVGAELDVWLLQFRLGYRHDLAGNYDGVPSVGVAVHFLGVHADFGVAGNDKDVSAALQVGFNF